MKQISNIQYRVSRIKHPATSIQQLVTSILLSFLILACTPTFDQNESDMSLTIPGGTVQLSGNPIWINTAGTATGTELKQLLRVVCTDGEIAGGPWIDEKPGSSASFDIHSIVDAPFLDVFDTDHVEYILGWGAPIAEITVEAGESYIDGAGDRQEVWSGSTTAMKIIKGKLNKEELVALNSASTNFYTEYCVYSRFLTNKFNKSIQELYVADVSHNVKQWVYRLYDADVSLYCTVHFSDNTEDSKNFAIEPFSESLLYELNCDLLAIDVCGDNPGKTPVWYIVNFGSGFTKVWITNRYHEVHEEFIFHNRRGGYEIVHGYGNLKINNDTQSETYTNNNGDTPDQYTPTVITQITSNQKKGVMNIGFKTEHDRKWTADLLATGHGWWKSERLVHLDGEDFGMMPINIVPNSLRVVDTQEDLMSMEFEFEIAHID